MIESQFQNGKKEGIEKKYYANGRLHIENNYREGLLHGDRVVFHKNGVLASKTKYINGKKSPEEKAYSTDGKLVYDSFIEENTGQRIVRYYYKTTHNISKEEKYDSKGGCFYRKLSSEDGTWYREYNPIEESKKHITRVRRIREGLKKKDIPIPIEDDEYDVISTVVLHHIYKNLQREEKIETAMIYPKSHNSHLLGQGPVCELPSYSLTGNLATIRDFIKKNLKSYTFENKFKGSNTVKLVADNVLRYPNAIGCFQFSRVGFNFNRTEAIVFFELWGRGYLIFVKKYEHKWHNIKTELINIIQI